MYLPSLLFYCSFLHHLTPSGSIKQTKGAVFAEPFPDVIMASSPPALTGLTWRRSSGPGLVLTGTLVEPWTWSGPHRYPGGALDPVWSSLGPWWSPGPGLVLTGTWEELWTRSGPHRDPGGALDQVWSSPG